MRAKTNSISNRAKALLVAFCAVTGVLPGVAGTLTRITWTSHNGAYINDTIVDSTTSPLAFTATNNLSMPFLNAADSTIALSYGTYYAISFRSYGAHTGAGTVSFVVDDGTTYSQNGAVGGSYSGGGRRLGLGPGWNSGCLLSVPLHQRCRRGCAHDDCCSGRLGICQNLLVTPYSRLLFAGKRWLVSRPLDDLS
jgi:hypothetical protein